MKVNPLHRWDLTPKEAIALQKELATEIVIQPLQKMPVLLAGVDVAYYRDTQQAYGAVVVIKLPELTVVEKVTLQENISFPYVSGLLSFRELPVLCKIFEKLQHFPDVVICDGQGIAHPRGLGLASHLGLFLNLPTIGCAKTLLVGEYKPPSQKRWAKSILYYKNNAVGMVVRTRSHVKPVIISPGHLIDIESSVEIIKQCTTRYRLPEPTRLAHQCTQRVNF